MTQKSWYLVQCKPRQDARAEEHLVRQGYVCWRPTYLHEALYAGKLRSRLEPLFPGYLFINLGPQCSWVPLRSTRGVSRIVAFGGKPVVISDPLLEQLQRRAEQTRLPVIQCGSKVRILNGGFANTDAIFLEMDGQRRVILLIDMLNRQQMVSLPLADIATR